MISVVIPAYNAEKYIAASIESILHQSFQNFEVIVVDDGSTDSTVAIAEQYGQRDSRVRLVRSQSKGVSGATNSGIQASNFNWVAIQHADDVALPHRLEKQVEAALLNPDVVGWGGYAYLMGSRSKLCGISQAGPTSLDEFNGMQRRGDLVYIIHSTALLKKDVVLAAGGYDLSFPPCEDVDLFDRMTAYGALLAIPQPLICRRIHNESITTKSFFRMQFLTRYIKARREARINNKPIPEVEEFAGLERSRPLRERISRRRAELGRYGYAAAGLNYSNRRPCRAICYFGLSCLFTPVRASRRIRRQRVSNSLIPPQMSYVRNHFRSGLAMLRE